MPAASTKRIAAPKPGKAKKPTKVKKAPPPLIEGSHANLYCVQATCWLKIPKSDVKVKKCKNGKFLAQGEIGGKKGCRFICDDAVTLLK